MSRQIEIDFFALESTTDNVVSRNTDLFGTVDSSQAPEMKLAHENSSKTAKITAHVSDQDNDIFNAA